MPSKRDVRSNAAPDEFVYLGLHQAALSGNVGLVKYALSQGQPVDAVWDGISALHAAAAGGSEHVARLLVESGADVSFGRLPRSDKTRTLSTTASTSSDKTADSSLARNPRGDRELKPRSASSSWTSTPEALLNVGSTPLHFACAHNHVAVARLLLNYGAAPHIRDRCGLTPLDLLPPAHPDSTADSLRMVIREYYEAEKAKEKEFQKSHVRFHGKAAAVLGFPREDDATPIPPTTAPASMSSTRVAVKRSLENLLSKSPKHVPAPLTAPPALAASRRVASGTGTPPPSPRRPSLAASERIPPSPTRFTFGSATPPRLHPPQPPDLSPPTMLEQRRPSLPHVFEDSPPRAPAAAVRPELPPASGPRPRSAGSGSGSGAHPPAFGALPFATPGHVRPPRTKRSLLSLFKKGESAPASESGSRRGAEMGMGDGNEVRTAPAGRTSFPADGGLVEDPFCEDEDEEYGVPLPRVEYMPPARADSPTYMYPEAGRMESPLAGRLDSPLAVRVDSPLYAADEDNGGSASGEDEDEEDATVEDDGDPALALARASTDATVRPPAPPRAGILRSERGVRPAGSRGALRFEAHGGRARSRSGSRSASGSGSGREDAAAVRARGGSVSSASTDASAPARSVVSQDTNTTAGSVPALLLGDSSDEEAAALSVRTVSSHAQAEALVQQAAKEILELNSDAALAERTLSLSAQLAAYGETLQLERRFARGEAQRFKRAAKVPGAEVGVGAGAGAGGGGMGTDEEGERRREEERRRRMVWTQREMERYAREGGGGGVGAGGGGAGAGARERRGLELLLGEVKEVRPQGVPLGRTTSLEKELEAGVVTLPTRPRPQKMRRPHTSDSVASGNGAPPRFGHSTTHSSSSVLRPHELPEVLRVLNGERRSPRHHPSRSASATPRAESFDHIRRATAPTPTPAADDSLAAPRDSADDKHAASRGSPLASATRSTFPPPALALDEFGASTTSIRPPKQRFGLGLRSLFGKSK